MAWFRRNREAGGSGDDAAAVAEPAPEPAPEPVSEPVSEPVADVPPKAADEGPASVAAPAWTTAAPLPSVVPTIQRVLDRVDARGGTALGRPAPLALAPLGHAVTPDAPAGAVQALTVVDDPAGAPSFADQPPLEYVQRAPEGSAPPGSPAPAQLLVPAYQPSRLPSIPVAAPEVQRAPAAPSLTTAPAPPAPPVVLPVGEILAPPAPAPPAAAVAPAADAPLLAAPAVDQPPAAPGGADVPAAAPAADLPLAPVQRHADHPGHVDGDDEPAPTATDVQRAAADTAPTPPLPDAPLSSATPLGPPPTTDVQRAPDVQPTPTADLPLAPVQRHADHPGHVDGDDEPAPTATDVQRAAAAAPLVGDAAPLVAPPAPPAADAPAPPPPAPDLPLPATPVQRSGAPRRPVGLGRPLTSVPTGPDPAPVQRAPSADPLASAPLVGEAVPPVPPPLAAVQRAAGGVDGDDQPDAPDHAPDAAGPPLDLVQRAAVDAVAPLVGAAPLGPTSPDTDAAPTAGPDEPSSPPPDLALAQRAPLGEPSAATSSSSAPASSTTSAATPATSASTPPAPPLVVAPLLGGRPFSTRVQRAAQDGASAPTGVVDRTAPEALSPEPGLSYQPLAGIGVWNGAPPPDLPGPAVEAPPSHVAAAVQRATGANVSNVRIRRDTGPVAQRLAARAFTHEGEVHIPAAVGSLSSGEGASLATHELVHAGQQSAMGSARPLEHTPEGQALEAQARSAEHASLAGLELPRMPLAPPAQPAVQRSPAEPAPASPFSPLQLSRLIDLADNPPTNGTSVQRRVLPPDPPPPPPPAEAAVAPAPPPPSARPQTPQELEELATQLFPTMRNLFRTELLGFRRRSGTSSDRPLS